MNHIITVLTSVEIAKDIIISMMQDKEYGIDGMLIPRIVHADGQKIISNFYKDFETRICLDEYINRKDFYLRKSPSAKYTRLWLRPSFEICEKITKELQRDMGCVSFSMRVESSCLSFNLKV
jgi:hypothetical protein